MSNDILFDRTRSWASFGLDKRLFKALARLEYVHPTQAQSQSLTAALAGQDVMLRAQTGSGKTLAFLLPTLQLVLAALKGAGDEGGSGAGTAGAGAGVLAVILVPSKELVEQTRAALQVSHLLLR